MDITSSIERKPWQVDPAITDEQALIASVARTFAAWRLAPRAAARDRDGEFPSEDIGALGELGLLAMKVPGEDGGGGTDNVGYVLAMEAIAEACASTAVVLASSNLAAKLLADHGTIAQKQRWLAPYAAGRLGPASFALSEPDCGSDAAALTTTALPDGDGWVLSGSKMWITSGAHAGLHLVFARTDGPGPAGISCFIVERDTPGLAIGKEEDKMGQRASGTVALHFDDCRIRADHLLGARGAGYTIALSALGAGRVGIAALSIGLAEAALAAGVAYARERRAFGRAVTDFQNTQFAIADCRTELDAAWLLALRAARALDEGHKAAAETSMAKLFASEACGRVVDRMVQLHGGYGYSRDYTIERLYRDARVTRIYEGTSEIQRLVIARELLREVA
ncbi:MAG TPA: acyl-CoA dehydrogenase family protein [Kofleriaceae bacterium]|nr:acyl-CoA dehydrogenase family protein [Kofleriaceae bacterium]